MTGDMQRGGAGIQHDDIAIFYQCRGALANTLFAVRLTTSRISEASAQNWPGCAGTAPLWVGQHPGLFQLTEIGTNGCARHVEHFTSRKPQPCVFFPRILSNFSCRSSANIVPLLRTMSPSARKFPPRPQGSPQAGPRLNASSDRIMADCW